MIHSFSEEYSKGYAGECSFLEHFNSYQFADNPTSREYDFICSETGDTVELKTDYYDMNRTPNFAIEKYSDIHRQSLGGPFRITNCKYFVYYFISNKTFYWMNCLRLKELLNNMELSGECGDIIKVRNTNHVTGIYKIRRDSLSGCIDRIIEV